MTDFRFGLKRLEEKANVEVKLKSKFGLTPAIEEAIPVPEEIKPYEHLYMGTNSTPAYLIDFNLVDFKEASTLLTTASYFSAAVADRQGGYIYFASADLDPRILKVRISDFTIVDTLVLSGFSQIKSGVFDEAAGYIYFAAGFDILKFNIKTFTVEDVLTINENYIIYDSFGVIDSVAGYLYFTRPDNRKIIKIRISDFTHVDTLTFTDPDYRPQTGEIDIDGGYAYFGANNTVINTAHILKIKLSTFTLADTLNLGTMQEFQLYSGSAIDAKNGTIYFGTNTDPGKLLKLRIIDFTITDTIILEVGEDGLETVEIDGDKGYTYCTTYRSPGSDQSTVIKVRLSDFTRVDSTVLSVGKWGIFVSVIV